MILNLAADRRLADVQADFNKLFPYLKIDFFTVPHDEGTNTWSRYQVFDHDKTLGDISRVRADSQLEFTPDTKTGEFEQTIEMAYGLHVQVFRRSMSTWLSTSVTDKWTLAKQNQAGEESAHTLTEMIYHNQEEE
jgi:hypothetical protein